MAARGLYIIVRSRYGKLMLAYKCAWYVMIKDFNRATAVISRKRPILILVFLQVVFAGVRRKKSMHHLVWYILQLWHFWGQMSGGEIDSRRWKEASLRLHTPQFKIQAWWKKKTCGLLIQAEKSLMSHHILPSPWHHLDYFLRKRLPFQVHEKHYATVSESSGELVVMTEVSIIRNISGVFIFISSALIVFHGRLNSSVYRLRYRFWYEMCFDMLRRWALRVSDEDGWRPEKGQSFLCLQGEEKIKSKNCEKGKRKI